MKLTLPTDSAVRKEVPMYSGVLAYAPAAFAGMARVSKKGNDKHNPGEPLHHARGKSTDHADCIVRHLMDAQDILAHIARTKENGIEVVNKLLDEVDQLTWRAALFAQEIHEKYAGAPLAPGARLPEPPADTNRLCRAYNLASDDRCLQNALHTGDHCGTYSNWPVAPDAAQQTGLPVIVELMAKGAAQVPAGTDAAIDSLIAQITGGASPETSAAIERATFPPLSLRARVQPCVWETDRGTWYFNRDDGLAENGASREEYPSEADARAAYWADRDAQLVPVDG